MFNNLLRVNGNEIIVDKGQLITLAALAAGVVVLLLISLIALKSRKKSFIRTIPTNLKDVK